MAQVTVEVAGVFLRDEVVLVVRDQAAVVVIVMKQVLQRSDLVLVMQISIDRDEVIAGDHLVEDMVVGQVAAASIVEVAVVGDLSRNNQVINSICTLLLIQK